MPTLNIDVNARTEKAKRDLRALDKEVLKISKSETILEKALKKAGDVGPKAFRKIQSAAVRQAKAVNSSALQFKQLRAQMTRLGSDPQAIGRVTTEFIRFRKEMERGIVGTTRFQRAQDRLKATMGATKRQMAATAAATNKANIAARKGGKSFTGLGHTLENLGSTAVLVAGPLSGIGSRLIAFGAIAKRGSLGAAALFSSLAGGGVVIAKAIGAFDQLNLSLAKTEAILKATGKQAQLTAGIVNEIAANVARKTLANLEETRPVAAGLLSFRGIDSSNLEEVLTLAQDVASTGFTDITNAGKLLGRAMEDPLANMDALRRVFIQLTPLQKEQVANFQNMGRGAEAAGVIFDVLRKKFGGVGEAQNTGLSGALDLLGQAWTELLESMGGGTLYNIAVNSIEGITNVLDNLRLSIINFKKIMKEFTDTGVPKVSVDLSDLDLTPRHVGPHAGAGSPAAPSHFEKALIDKNTDIKKSLVGLGAEMDKLRVGYTFMAPEILNLAQKHKVYDDIVKVLAGNLGGLTSEGKRIADQAIKTNKALLDFANKQEAFTIFKDTRTALVKYNDELRRLVFLYDNGYISANALIIKQKELRATLESTTPELNALTSASNKFGDSLTDLMIKGEDFASGLKSIFKSLVDDILKQFLKLAVINPIMNQIFGASAARPQLGSQGGGILGLGGAGGLLGRMTGGAANDNQKPFDKTIVDFEKRGLEQAGNYGKALEKTNVKIEQVGNKAAGNLSDVFSNIGGGVASAVGGGLGSFLGHKVADLLGFQHGGSFKVGGSGGRDSQLVAFKASPREKVSVETPMQQGRRGNGNVIYMDNRGVDPGQVARIIEAVKDLDESIEIRAVNATADARDRNPSLYGRTL